MKKLKERLDHCIPYLRVATLVSRETIHELMMRTDIDTVYSLRAVMVIGMEAYRVGDSRRADYPCKLFGETLKEMAVFRPADMELELDNMLELKDFRKYIIAGMAVLGIY